MSKATELKIKALYKQRKSLINSRKQLDHPDYPILPWVEVDEEEEGDTKEQIDEAIYIVEGEIISLERSLRDPEQDAEMRAEINASIALSGNWDDNASHYMHTPLEEEMFQEGIYRQVMYEHDGYDSEGEGYSCNVCQMHVWSDEATMINGWDFCTHCSRDGIAWFVFLAFIMGYGVDGGKWDYEWQLVREEEEVDA
jgi:hypothetical protein